MPAILAIDEINQLIEIQKAKLLVLSRRVKAQKDILESLEILQKNIDSLDINYLYSTLDKLKEKV